MESKEGLSHVVYRSLPSLSYSEIPCGGDGAELTRHDLVPSNARPIIDGEFTEVLNVC